MNSLHKILSLLVGMLCFQLGYGQEFEWKQQGGSTFLLKVPNYDEIGLSLNTSPLNTFYYDINRFKPGSFTLIVKDGQGRKVREAEVKDGRMGKETWWYSEGKKQWEADWGYTDIIVSKTKYYRNGKKELETLADGTTTVWYNNGNIRIEQTIVKGMRDKDYRQYYENGNIAQEGEYEKGVKTGEWKYYTQEGELIGTKKHN